MKEDNKVVQRQMQYDFSAQENTNDSNRIYQTVSSDVYEVFAKVINKRAFLEEAILIAFHMNLPGELRTLLHTRDIDTIKKLKCEISE